MCSSARVAILMIVAAGVAAPCLWAQPAAGDGWTYTIAPYLVAAGMNGSVTVRGVEQRVDVPFSDVIEDLELAGMVHFDMRNGRWAISSDLIFVDLGTDEDVARGTAAVSVEETLLEVAGGYRVSEAVTLLAGARWVDLRTGLAFSGPAAGLSGDQGKSWVDPLVGAHVAAPLGDRWWIGLHGDVGGFGVGSELAWQAYADIGFRASDVASVVVGYRAIDIDYEDGSGHGLFRYDVRIDGPQVGVVFRF